MRLIHYWPFDSNTLDSVGDGSDAGGAISAIAGSNARGGACIVTFPKLDSDFTISFDIYRVGYTADWCIDFGTNDVYWGTGMSNSGYMVGYSPNYRLPNMYMSSPKIGTKVLFEDTKETIGVWYHGEIHRYENTHLFFINGELKLEWEDATLDYPDHCYFFNAGSHQTGGGYVKELKIYPSPFAESLGDKRFIYNHLRMAYAIPKNNKSL